MRRTAFTCSSVGIAVGFAQSGNNRFGAAVSLEPESINALGSLNCADSRRAGNYRSMYIAGSRSKVRKDWRLQLPPFERGREENRRGVGVQAGLEEPLSVIRRGFARQARGTDKLSRINKKMPRKTATNDLSGSSQRLDVRSANQVRASFPVSYTTPTHGSMPSRRNRSTCEVLGRSRIARDNVP